MTHPNKLLPWLTRAEKTSLKNNSFFDIITILDLLEHADDERVLKEAYRILKKGGLVIITVPAYQFLWSRWDEILGLKRRYDKTSLATLLSNCFSFLLLPAMVVRMVKSLLYKNATYPSDFALGGGGFGNSFFGTLSSWERFMMIKMNVSIPFGLSLVAVASQGTPLRS